MNVLVTELFTPGKKRKEVKFQYYSEDRVLEHISYEPTT